MVTPKAVLVLPQCGRVTLPPSLSLSLLSLSLSCRLHLFFFGKRWDGLEGRPSKTGKGNGRKKEGKRVRKAERNIKKG
jgi:hypothetical protein